MHAGCTCLVGVKVNGAVSRACHIASISPLDCLKQSRAVLACMGDKACRSRHAYGEYEAA